jgi:hypothetical protein
MEWRYLGKLGNFGSFNFASDFARTSIEARGLASPWKKFICIVCKKYMLYKTFFVADFEILMLKHEEYAHIYANT